VEEDKAVKETEEKIARTVEVKQKYLTKSNVKA